MHHKIVSATVISLILFSGVLFVLADTVHATCAQTCGEWEDACLAGCDGFDPFCVRDCYQGFSYCLDACNDHDADGITDDVDNCPSGVIPVRKILILTLWVMHATTALLFTTRTRLTMTRTAAAMPVTLMMIMTAYAIPA